MPHLPYYEGLVGSRGGGSDEHQREVVSSIGKFLEITPDAENVETIANRIYTTKSATFNKGRIGAWRTTFKEEHKKLFKELAGELLIAFGYETNNRW